MALQTVFVKNDFVKIRLVMAADGEVVKFRYVTAVTRVPFAHTFGSGDGVIVRESTGVYSVTIQADELGRWHYQWDITNSGGASGLREGSFDVVTSRVTP